MKRKRWKWAISALLGAALLAAGPAAGRALAQGSPTASASVPMLKLYVDSRGQVFTTPARGRRLLTEIPATALAPAEIEKRVEQKTQAQLQQTNAEISKVAAKNAELAQKNQQLSQQVAEMKPAWQNYSKVWFKKIHFGLLVYGDYRFMSHTGFGPQFMSQMMWPGVGNNGYNAFDITRTYLDFKFTPDEDWLMRVTPNIFASTCGSCGAKSVGKSTQWGSSVDGNLSYRLKYGYLQYKSLFQKLLPVEAMKGDTVTFGQQANPLVAWEENMYGYRWVSLTPWNYLSLSSSQIGLSMQGPIKFNELEYIDYDFGVYNDASFHAYQQSNTKQVMARLTVYPLGAKANYQSLGFTAFGDYGWGNNPPDVSDAGGGTQNWRNAFLVHYNAKNWAIAGEFDIGKNALSKGQLFSGAGPCTSGSDCSFVGWNTMVGDVLNNQATQQGWDFFGHYDIPNTKFSVFGLFQQFLPNTKLDKNPLDFQRWLVGVAYTVNKHVRFAVDSQNILYYHSQFTLPQTQLGSITVPKTPYAVPRDTHAILLNFRFSY